MVVEPPVHLLLETAEEQREIKKKGSTLVHAHGFVDMQHVTEEIRHLVSVDARGRVKSAGAVMAISRDHQQLCRRFTVCSHAQRHCRVRRVLLVSE